MQDGGGVVVDNPHLWLRAMPLLHNRQEAMHLPCNPLLLALGIYSDRTLLI